MPFTYSVFTLITPEYTIRETAELLAKLGYNGVEWRVHSVPEDLTGTPDYWRNNKATIDIDAILEKAPEMRKISEDNGLEIVGLGTYLSCKLLDDVKRCMEAAKIMGAPSVRVSPPGYDGTQDYNDLYEEALDGFAKVENLAREYKIRASLEIHHGRICPCASLAYRLVSNFDPDYIGVIYDPGNMVFEGHENWQMGLELLGPYLAYVHVKNAMWFEAPGVDGEKNWKATVAPLKEGFVPWRRVLSALDKVGYKGWLSFEDFSLGDTKTKLTDDLAYMKRLEGELGI